ncbi:MAG: ATP-dependent DNA ligase [Candidatus Bathyarchaeia archaeon]
MEGAGFSELVDLCRALESTTKRTEKKQLLATFLQRLRSEEVSPTVLLITGSIFPETDDAHVLDVGWATLRRVMRGEGQRALSEGSTTIIEVHGVLKEVAETSGRGSKRRKRVILEGLFGRLTPVEREYLLRFIFGEPRIGVSEGVMLEGIAEAAEVPLSLVRRAHMFTGDLGKVAKIALTGSGKALQSIGISLFTPVKPMLAEMSYDLQEVIKRHGGRTAFEYKFDGARIQVHRRGEEIRVFSRRLSDVTSSLPDIVEVIEEGVSAEEVILDGEVIAVGPEGRPFPFQDLMRRFRRVHDVEELVEKIPLNLHLFDVLYLDGDSLIDEPYERRWGLLSGICKGNLLVERIVTGEVSEVEAFLERAVKAGHEGLMVKRLDSDYAPGKRGKKWFKIKPAETLDLVIVAADWGSGRRRGWLSNYHLGAWDEEGGAFRVIGKTFKGLTDEEFTEMTGKLQGLKVRESSYTVYVKPRIVVEVSFNEIQRSPRYASGFALRFARITRIREDKAPEEADTLERVGELYKEQFRYKAKAEFNY